MELGHRTSAPPDRAVRLPLFDETIAYLGSILLLSGLATVVASRWHQMSFGVRFVVAAALASVGLTAGAALVRIREPGTQRMAGYCWAIGVAGVTLAADLVVTRAGADDGGVKAVLVGTAVTLVSVLLWRNQDRPLQLLSTVAGLVATALGAGALLHIAAWHAAPAVMAASFVVAALAVVHSVHPALLALLLASIGAMVGAAMLTEMSDSLCLAVGAVTAVGVVATGLATRHTSVVVVGVGGFLQFLQRALVRFLSGPLTVALVVLLGGALLGVVVVDAVRSARQAAGHIVAEPHRRADDARHGGADGS